MDEISRPRAEGRDAPARRSDVGINMCLLFLRADDAAVPSPLPKDNAWKSRKTVGTLKDAVFEILRHPQNDYFLIAEEPTHGFDRDTIVGLKLFRRTVPHVPVTVLTSCAGDFKDRDDRLLVCDITCSIRIFNAFTKATVREAIERNLLWNIKVRSEKDRTSPAPGLRGLWH